MITVFSARLRAQVIKELLSTLRDPKNRAILIGPPLMQLLIFAFAATLEVTHIDLALLNQDPGRMGHEVSQRLSHSYFVHDLKTAHHREEASQWLAEGQVLGFLVIPEDFSRQLASAHSGAIQAIMDGRKSNAAQIAVGYLQQVLNEVDRDLGWERGQSHDLVATRFWFNPNLTYQWFVVPSLAGTLVMFATLMVTALSIARERELGTFDQLLVSPCTALEIIIAKVVPAVVVGLGLGMIMLLSAHFIFGIPFTGSATLLAASLLLFILSIVGIGLMISSVCNTQQQAILGTFSVGVPAVLMSGFATPIENMPKPLQILAEAIPLKHFLIIVQGSFLKALPPAEVLNNAWPLAIIFAVTFSIAVRFVGRRLQ